MNTYLVAEVHTWKKAKPGYISCPIVEFYATTEDVDTFLRKTKESDTSIVHLELIDNKTIQADSLESALDKYTEDISTKEIR